jgi:hypothetical protein
MVISGQWSQNNATVGLRKSFIMDKALNQTG